MPPVIHTFSDEINYLVWRYLRESNLTQTAWTLEAEIKSKSGKDVVSVHEEVGRNVTVDLMKRMRMSMQYQEVLKHMSEDGDLPCTAPFTLLSEHKCNKGDESRVPIADVVERPWQLEPASFPHGEPLALSNAVQQPRQSRRLNRDETTPNGPAYPLPKVKPGPTSAKRRKPNSLPSNPLAVGIVEEEESNLDDEMDEDTVVMNGEDVVMKDAPSVKSEPETIQVIPNDGPLQFGDPNTFIAAWNDKAILATGQTGQVRMWTIHPRGEERLVEQHVSLPLANSGDVTSLCWHVYPENFVGSPQPDDSLLAVGTYAGLTTVWNIEGALRASLPSPNGPIFTLKFNPSGSLLVTCSANGVFEIYGTKDWASIFKVPAATNRIWETQAILPCTVWLDDSRLAIIGPNTPNAVVNCWQFDETHATTPFMQFVGHEGLINDLAYDKQTGFIATASEDQTVRLWKTDKENAYHDFRNHMDSVKAVAFQPTADPDAQTRVLASASWDGTVSLYDISTFTLLHSIGKEIHNFPGDRISSTSWSPDGRYLCSGDLEGVVGVWEWRDSIEPRAFGIWAPDRVMEDQQDHLPNGTNGHKDEQDRPVLHIQWQKTGQSFVVCRQNRRMALIDWRLEQVR